MSHHKIDILFILKKNETYGFKTMTKRSSGLWNSTRFIVEAMQAKGIKAEIVEVIDNNCIDRVVTQWRPKIVIIEALWVVSEKFDVLKRLHPLVKWYVHMHSGMAFLAQEGIATEWLRAYPNHGVGVIANSQDTYEAFKLIIPEDLLEFLPNVYIPYHFQEAKVFDFNHRNVIQIGCFGAIRPLKNQLVQAFAAIKYATEHDLYLEFHINGTRKEVGGEPIHKNLKNLFAHQKRARLVEHPWYEPEDFLRLLKDRIDLSMQLSLSETFNVVSADAVTSGVPIVVSNEVRWASRWAIADTEDLNNITRRIDRVLRRKCITWLNQGNLQSNSEGAQDAWLHFIRTKAY